MFYKRHAQTFVRGVLFKQKERGHDNVISTHWRVGGGGGEINGIVPILNERRKIEARFGRRNMMSLFIPARCPTKCYPMIQCMTRRPVLCIYNIYDRM